MLHYDNEKGLSDLQEVVYQTARSIGQHLSEFDSIAVQGTSGLLIGAPVALILDKPLVIVREDAELQCWHSSDVENAANAGRRVLFLDDQISSGATLQDVKRKLGEHSEGRVSAIYLYEYDEYTEGAGPNTVPDQRRSVSDLLGLLRSNPWSQQ